MRSAAATAISSLFLACSLFVPQISQAQTAPAAKPAQTGPAGEASPEMQRYRDMQNLMQDMAKSMSAMNDQMTKGAPDAQSRKDMSAKMKAMSRVMTRMSGLLDRPTMKDAQANREIAQMKKQMQAMSPAPSAKGAGK